MTEQLLLTEQVPHHMQLDLAAARFTHDYGNYPQAEAEHAAIADDLIRAYASNPNAWPPLEQHILGEAWRGQAAAQGQQGTNNKLAEGLQHAGEAVVLHQGLVDEYPEVRNNLRLDHVILGRLSLQKAISSERFLRRRPEDDIQQAGASLAFAVETHGSDAPSAQVLVNSLWLKALHGALYGPKTSQDTRQALRMGWQSEAKGAPSSNPELSPLARLKAKVRATARPLGVMTVSALAGKPEFQSLPTIRRKAALHIAHSLILGPKRVRALASEF